MEAQRPSKLKRACSVTASTCSADGDSCIPFPSGLGSWRHAKQNDFLRLARFETVGPFLFAWNRTKIRHSTSVIPRRMIGVAMADEHTIRALGEQAYLFHL